MIGADGLVAVNDVTVDPLVFAGREPYPLWFCTQCKNICSDHDVVVCAPLGRTYVLDGIPEDGYEPKKIAALVSERLCRECAS